MPNPYKVISIVLLAAFSLGTVALFQPEPEPPDPNQAPRLGVLYAAPLERVETHVLARGETVQGVLAQARITGQELAQLLLGLRGFADERRMSAGAEVTVRRWSRTDEPRAVDFRLDADKTVRLVRAEVGGWSGEVVMTPTVVDTVWAAGVIDAGKTLSEAIVMDEQSRLLPQERYKLVYELASIYEFKLDFTREIQPGDAYRVVYEREVRPDGTARTTQVLAAEIVTRGTSYPAYYFDGGNGIRGFFDAEARPLADGFSKYPVEFRRITSNYNPRRYHPILGVYRAHQGTDFGGSSGTPVLATADGTVVFAGTSGGYGRLVEIRHHSGYTTRYAHLSAYGKGIRVGARVKQKQMIGRIGASGLATAPHLHYELRKNGRPVDAMRHKLPGAPPIPGAMKARFLAAAEQRSTLLERISSDRYYAEAKAPARGANADDGI